MKFIILALINIYRRFLSFDQGLLRFLVPLGSCRFSPSCSEYTKEAIVNFGIIKGIVLGGSRLMRCHPLSQGGYDPLPKKG